jgi:hypothetical protein
MHLLPRFVSRCLASCAVTVIVMVCSLLMPTTSRAQAVPFDQNVFDAWVDCRVGNGSKPVWWYCYGEVYSYPDGELVSYMQGIDVANMIRVAKDSVIQINRKTFVYLDKTTKEVLANYDGKPVNHIEYPYQQITYALRGDKLVTYVTQGKGKRLTTIGPGYKTLARKAGDNFAFSAPVFLKFPLPNGGVLEAWENYDFVSNVRESKTSNKYQLFWERFGDLAPFFGANKKGVIQLTCYRVDTLDDVPQPLQNHIRTKAQLWMNPPKDLSEISQLQKE